MVQRQCLVCSNTCKISFVIVLVILLNLFSIRKSRTFYYCPTNTTEQQFTEALIDLAPDLEVIDENDFDNNLDDNIDDDAINIIKRFDIDKDDTNFGKITDEMKVIINKLRDQIRKELQGYKLPSSRSIEGLFPERGGTPMRNIVISTWRSGSTFIGGVLNSHPATFHYSEPLTHFMTVQVRGEPLAGPAVRTLRSQLTCDYRVLGRYLERFSNFSWLNAHNTRWWAHCKDPKRKSICWQPQFLTAVCRLFPFLSMKTVHIRLRQVEPLLADPRLNVRVVLQIRDPRGILQSRSKLVWCTNNDDCGHPAHVCSDMADDYSAALRFSKLYPKRFRIVRYEDMSLKPHSVIPDLFKFFGLQYHPDVQQFVKVHTTKNYTHAFSTFRNSTETALMWRKRSEFSRVREIQDTCRVALSAWGYLPAHNASHMLDFNPLVQPFTWP